MNQKSTVHVYSSFFCKRKTKVQLLNKTKAPVYHKLTPVKGTLNIPNQLRGKINCSQGYRESQATVYVKCSFTGHKMNDYDVQIERFSFSDYHD